ncbi:MAG: sigma-70 family RNA polymerase sigma factor [Oscillospiraceae bacterium]|nr:sigma-70 family RNA polymerase sigma factor [Oscillospiraceae bacterium]
MEDREIVELYWRRSDDALRETERKYGGYCRTVAGNVLRSAEDAEECVNDTWLRAWNAMPDKRPAKLGAFLAKITRNLALQRLERSSRLKRGGGEATLALEELAECVADGSDVEREIERRELSAALRRFLLTLSERERRVFVSRYWYMASVEEISRAFGFTQSKTKSLLSRLRARLRAFLEKEDLC